MNADLVLPDSAWTDVAPDVQALVDCWLAEPGAHVEAGSAVVRVVLVKSTLEVAAPVAGRLMEVLVQAGENFSRGQPLGRIQPDPR